MSLLLLYQHCNPFFVIFAAVKQMRTISPFISVVLMMLMLSGSLGYTLVRHSCLHCGTEMVTAILGNNGVEETCCCGHHDKEINHGHGTGETLISDDCCSHEAERVVTDDLVRSQVENEIMPYFMVAAVVAVMQDQPARNIRSFFSDRPFHHGSDLTTMHCQIIS